MNEPKLTPGPWNINHGTHDNYVRVNSTSHQVALIRHPVAEADLKLIAAAPDLYAALKEAVEWDSHDDGGVPALWLDVALAALAKARGEG